MAEVVTLPGAEGPPSDTGEDDVDKKLWLGISDIAMMAQGAAKLLREDYTDPDHALAAEKMLLQIGAVADTLSGEVRGPSFQYRGDFLDWRALPQGRARRESAEEPGHG
jgi:hypothetical protein